MVVDRFKVRSDLATRLAESFETALELSGGTAVVADMDNPKAEEFGFLGEFCLSALWLFRTRIRASLILI